MYFEDTILDYIELVRNSVPNAIEVFTKGNCGPFSLMLLKTFPGGEIKELFGHRLYEYKGNWYDITGKVKTDYNYQDAIPILDLGLDKAIQLLKPKYESKV